MIEPDCFGAGAVCGQTCYDAIAADCVGGTTCQLQDPLPETFQGMLAIGQATMQSLEEQYCRSPANACNGVLFDPGMQSCADGVVMTNTDGFFCDMSSSVWCTSDQACRKDLCFDLDDLCSSDKAIVCSEDYYDYLNPDGSGGKAAAPLRFICEDVEDDFCTTTGDNGDGSGVAKTPGDGATSGATSIFIGNMMRVLAAAMVAIL